MVTTVQRMSCICHFPFVFTLANYFCRQPFEACLLRAWLHRGRPSFLGSAAALAATVFASLCPRPSIPTQRSVRSRHGAERPRQRCIKPGVQFSSRPPIRSPHDLNHDSITSRVRMGSAIRKEFIKLRRNIASSPNLLCQVQRNICGIGLGQVEWLTPSGRAEPPIPSRPVRAAGIAPRTMCNPLRTVIQSRGQERHGSSERVSPVVPVRHLQSTTWFEPPRPGI